MKRRDVLVSASCLASATATAKSTWAGREDGKTFLLIHGAWHGAAHWNHVSIALIALGHRVVAVDLPGSGLSARFPSAYVSNDSAGMMTERSKIADVSLADYADSVLPLLSSLFARHGKVTVLAHSFGGATLNLLAERAPQLIRRLVYMTAYCPASPRGGSMNDYSLLPENSRSLVGGIIIADPNVVGAFRINPRSTDASYLERARETFYGDVSLDVFLDFAAFLGPDLPLRVARDDARGTVARWGRVPRSYIRCTLDRAIPIELQDRMIREADEMTPHNRFSVATLEASHSPFASMPQAVARVLSDMP